DRPGGTVMVIQSRSVPGRPVNVSTLVSTGGAHMSRKYFLLLTVVGLLGGAGCISYSEPPNNREPEYSYSTLIEPEGQREILAGRYDRERLRREVGPPTVDDGEEWVYLGKYEDTSGIGLDDLLAITASLYNPTWKTVVVTFDTHVPRLRGTQRYQCRAIHCVKRARVCLCLPESYDRPSESRRQALMSPARYAVMRIQQLNTLPMPTRPGAVIQQ